MGPRYDLLFENLGASTFVYAGNLENLRCVQMII